MSATSSDNSTSSDNRKYPRIRISPPLTVIDTLSNDTLGMLVNLSKEGMMLLGDKAIVNDGVYQVRIPLRVTEDGEISLSIGVECLWSSPADIDAKSWSGFRIIDISELEQGLLDHTISELQRG